MRDEIPQIKVGAGAPPKGEVPSRPPQGSTESIVLPKLGGSKSAEQVQPSAIPNMGAPVQKIPPKRRLPRKLLIPVIILVVILLLIGVPVFGVYKSAQGVQASVKKLAEAGKSKDIQKITTELSTTKKALNGLKSSLMLLSWLRPFPLVGGYVSDAQHGVKAGILGTESAEIMLKTIEPYGDIIGLTGGKSDPAKDGEKTTQERMDFIIKSLPELTPKAKEITEKLAVVRSELEQINPDRYPEKIGKTPLRSKLKENKDMAIEILDLVINGRSFFENSPYLLGLDAPRTYLLIFQNDKELRPTGGFLTGYSLMKVDKGKVQPVSSDDIYNLDAKYKPKVPAPEPVVKYLKGPYLTNKNLRLRDMNWSPDFEESMDLFIKGATEAGIKGVDGIIAVDTELLVNFLDVTGQIGVPGFGNFSTKEDPQCKCPQVIHELEKYADVEGPIVWDPLGTGKIIYKPANADNRKKIIGPLMNSVLANVLGQPKEKLADLFEAGFHSLSEKHVLFYLNEEKVQKAAEEFRVAGKILDFKGDYLHINDANLGGRKSNLYTSQEVEQEYKLGKDGKIVKRVTITYKNPEKQDGWLNSVLPNWVRIYVPEGSELISFDGVEDKAEPYKELGKTVFAGYFQLRPEGVVKVTVEYKLPLTKGSHKLLIQKQPGTDKIIYRTIVGRSEEEFVLREDREFEFKI